MSLVETIRDRFSYQDGSILVKKSGQWKGKVGDEAGTVRPDGRRVIQVKGKRLFTHQVVWLMFNDKLPETTIDHKDRDPTNNRIGNLRPATMSEQHLNRGLSPINTSGFKGVSFKGGVKGKPWRATFRDKHLGYFASPEEAARAYDNRASEEACEFTVFNFQKGEDAELRRIK